ncbi:MAG: helix-turn-helix transcriptional regulator [Bacilli bacterium]|jgi:predicted transcriptional regulator|nr:helix-turn-helix transcriptional regulator [Bacilli bacterium]
MNELKRKEIEILAQIKQERENHGFSQRGLCAIINMQQPSLVKIEKGQISPQLDTLLKILEPLHRTLKIVPIDDKLE